MCSVMMVVCLLCSVLVLIEVYTVLFSGDLVVWVGHSGVHLIRVFSGLPPCAECFR